MRLQNMNWINLTQGMKKYRAVAKSSELSGSVKYWECAYVLTYLRTDCEAISFPKLNFLRGFNYLCI
jgi:hypothetical protein